MSSVTNQELQHKTDTMRNTIFSTTAEISSIEEKTARLNNEIRRVKDIHGGYIPPFTKERLLALGASEKGLKAIEKTRARLLGGMLPKGRFNKNTPSGSNPPPHAQGVYEIVNKTGSVVYVGETKDLARREAEHEASGKLGSRENFEWKQLHGNTSTETRRTIETNLIHKNDNPIRNQVKLK